MTLPDMRDALIVIIAAAHHDCPQGYTPAQANEFLVARLQQRLDIAPKGTVALLEADIEHAAAALRKVNQSLPMLGLRARIDAELQRREMLSFVSEAQLDTALRAFEEDAESPLRERLRAALKASGEELRK